MTRPARSLLARVWREAFVTDAEVSDHELRDLIALVDAGYYLGRILLANSTPKEIAADLAPRGASTAQPEGGAK